MIDIRPESLLVPQQISPLPSASRVLVLAPHPDDEVLGCGATLYRLVQSGVTVQVIIVTDGALGGAHDNGEVAGIRQQESIAAASVIGYPPPVFWGMADRAVRFNETLITRIMDAIQEYRSQLVFAPSLCENHPDHQATALAAQQALRRLAAKDPEFDARILFYEVSSPLVPNVLIDISEVESVKQRAIGCFTSQLALQPYGEQIAGLNRFRSYSLGDQVRSVEAFVGASARELDQLSLFQSGLGRRLAAACVIDAADLPRVVVMSEVDGCDASPSALASLVSQTYPHMFFGMSPDTDVPLPDDLLLFVNAPVIHAPDVVARMVDVFRERGLHAWGDSAGLRASGGALEMIRADRIKRREHLRYRNLSAQPESKPSRPAPISPSALIGGWLRRRFTR